MSRTRSVARLSPVRDGVTPASVTAGRELLGHAAVAATMFPPTEPPAPWIGRRVSRLFGPMEMEVA